MFKKADESGYKEVMEGVNLKTLVHGERTLLGEFRLTGGSVVPVHQHHHEQTGYLLSGRMRFLIGENSYEAEKGDSWCIPGNVEHGVEVLENSVVIEIFSPVREDYVT